MHSVEDYVDRPFVVSLSDLCSRMDQDVENSFYVMGVKSEAARKLFDDRRPFRVFEFVRSDRGIWAHMANAASLPLGCMSRPHWIRRMSSLTVIPPIEVGKPWSWMGRPRPGHVLVCMDIAAEETDMQFQVREADASQSWKRVQPSDSIDCEDLGCLVGDDGRLEIVLETSPTEARSIRQLPGVKHIAQRRVGHGRVRVTLDVDECLLSTVTSSSSLWAKSCIKARCGVLLYQTEEQWEQLGGILSNESWIAGNVLCESPRWVLVRAESQADVDVVLAKLTLLRTNGNIAHDISYRSWSMDENDVVT